VGGRSRTRSGVSVNLAVGPRRLKDMGSGPVQKKQQVFRLVDEAGVVDEDPSRPLLLDVESFESFYRREFPRLLVLAGALSGAANADDVAQESMLVAYRRWDEIRSLVSPVGYVRQICLHKAVSVTRRRAVERRMLHRLGSRPAPAGAPLPEDSELFWCEVRFLPRRQAQVVALYYGLDLSVVDVAGTLECAEGTVKAHLSRARETLATRLGQNAEELS
jgi:RNA polymerase sigma-70 factor (ECF subfamily)